MKLWMRGVWCVFKREFFDYFATHTPISGNLTPACPKTSISSFQSEGHELLGKRPQDGMQ